MPDVTTLLHFRRLLGQHDTGKKLVADMVTSLKRRACSCRVALPFRIGKRFFRYGGDLRHAKEQEASVLFGSANVNVLEDCVHGGIITEYISESLTDRPKTIFCVELKT